MPRLTRGDIERELLGGRLVTWKDASRKNQKVQLGQASERRLFKFLLGSKIRKPTELPQAFIDGLASAFRDSTDPSAQASATPATSATPSSWKLKAIETEGFGGLNLLGGPPLRIEFDGESALIQGPNGSGKSSLIGAVIWAMTGQRPRDQSDAKADEPAKVFDVRGKEIGSWPPIASYPGTSAQLTTSPSVRVTLTFADASGVEADIERKIENGVGALTWDPRIIVPDIFVETGIAMPTRLGQIRFDRNSSPLIDAVQKLTGLDELIEIGQLSAGLCHGGREYLSPKQKDFDRLRGEFEGHLDTARKELGPLGLPVAAFELAETDDATGDLAKLGRRIQERAAELTSAVVDDLAAGLDLSNSTTFQSVSAAISNAREEVEAGLEALPTWQGLETLGAVVTPEVKASLKAALQKANDDLASAVEQYHDSEADSRHRLKAMGAIWHSAHRVGAVADCPLCEQSLELKPYLAAELEALRDSSQLAVRSLSDNLTSIHAELERAVPAVMPTDLEGAPGQGLLFELTDAFVLKPRYAKFLATFTARVSQALSSAPSSDIVPIGEGDDEEEDSEREGEDPEDDSEPLRRRIDELARLLEMADWFVEHKGEWTEWWLSTATMSPNSDQSEDTDGEADEAAEDAGSGQTPRRTEGLLAHLDRLSAAIGQARPYQRAADALRNAWSSGKKARSAEQELEKRKEIAEALEPLKLLENLGQSQARETIEDLSDEIGKILKRLYVTERLAFQSAKLERKTGVEVRASFPGDLVVDATLVANTSWLRAALWAFLLAMRNEAVSQHGRDPLPILLLDDPQATFDPEHRHRWTSEIIGLQNSSEAVQIILTSHDEAFVELLDIDGLKGRHALIAAADLPLGRIGYFEGGAVERSWAVTKSLNTPRAGRTFMNGLRIHVEGMLQLMLRGEVLGVSAPGSGSVIGDSRANIDRLHKKSAAPWDKSSFTTLVARLGKGLAQIKHMEMAHHSSGGHLGMSEAIAVEEYWRKDLWPALETAFKVVREHRSLHGGMKALRPAPASCTLPEGYSGKLASIPLTVLGRAAALTGGRVADGEIQLSFHAPADKFVLGKHAAYRLNAPTMEPVASIGDILLLKEYGEPSPRSLVVAKFEDRLLARRFEISDNHSDVAVLTAHASNPREISPPVVAQRTALGLHKVIGVLFDYSGIPPAIGADEITDCGGESRLQVLVADVLGLVEISGDSSEPIALPGQFVLIGKPTSPKLATQHLDGRPVIASDASGGHYFKRLRATDGDDVVLESLHVGGAFPPLLRTKDTGESTDLVEVWPVLGVLFERPG